MVTIASHVARTVPHVGAKVPPAKAGNSGPSPTAYQQWAAGWTIRRGSQPELLAEGFGIHPGVAQHAGQSVPRHSKKPVENQ